ncbi:transcriptional regulator [Fusobacterium polymorphum]|uniref:Transcriptional regulator n=1 Tax=Fusobacterium nucleatum subsp. polymorphum TaxID=76857 RepID=A0A2C6BIA4_FUSNP|nr:transcriptional regulator [Fusobacterium polymorphum]PHI03575.1 transcriptional regulator [Fusobacterium polymorphum]
MGELKLKNQITSLDLLEQINLFRKEEYKEKLKNGTLTEAQKKRGKSVKLEHYDLLDIIRDEFSIEITDGKISVSEYKDTTGRKLPMFILTLSQAKQVLLRESKYVRRAIIHYIEVLEQAIIDKAKSEWLLTRQQGKLVRREETDAIQVLIEYAKKQGSQHSDKLYMTYSKLVNSLVGIKANSRDKVDFGILMIIRQLEDMFTRVITSSMENEIHYKEIYQICKKQGTHFIEIVNGNVKSLGYVN